jgi:hypothetical protein
MIWKDSIETDLKKVDCEDGKWMELPQDYVQWWASVSEVLNNHVLLLEC